MLYLAIPAHNEVATIGVLLWRLRTVLAEFPREYEVVVYDDASTDDTAAVAEQYERAMPVTVIRGARRLGYAGATDALLRHVAGMTRYPRRDAVLLLQGDFTDPPGIIPEFARRFDGGADLVVGERLTVADAPTPVRRLFKSGQWVMRPFVRVDGVRDLTASMRLVRISALRDAIRAVGDAPLLDGDSWTANADLLLRLVPHARRVEAVPMEPTFGVRMRDTRRVALRDAMALLKWSWQSRGRRAVAGSVSSENTDTDRRPGRGRRSERGPERQPEPELNIERLRERVRESASHRDSDGAREERGRRGRETRRDRSGSRNDGRAEGRETGREHGRDPARRHEPTEQRADRAERPDRPERAERQDRPERPPRAERPPRPTRTERVERTEPTEPRRPEPRRPESRRAEPRRPEPSPLDPTVELDDPFAAPATRRDAVDAPMASEQAVTPAPVWSPAPELLAEDDALGPDAPQASGSNQTDDEMDGGADDEGTESDGTGRRRRRNRRSRRGRRRRSGETSSTGEGEGDAPDTSDGGDEGLDRRPFEEGSANTQAGRNAADHAAADDATADDAGDDDERDGESDGDGDPSRPRRRGRRGRRGGARRSRGRRDRDQEATSDPFAPPPPPPDPFA